MRFTLDSRKTLPAGGHVVATDRVVADAGDQCFAVRSESHRRDAKALDRDPPHQSPTGDIKETNGRRRGLAQTNEFFVIDTGQRKQAPVARERDIPSKPRKLFVHPSPGECGAVVDNQSQPSLGEQRQTLAVR